MAASDRYRDFLQSPNATCGDCAFGVVPPAFEGKEIIMCVRDPCRSRFRPVDRFTPQIAAVSSDYPVVESMTRACAEFCNGKRAVK